jgi:hypothetical protein
MMSVSVTYAECHIQALYVIMKNVIMLRVVAPSHSPSPPPNTEKRKTQTNALDVTIPILAF